MSVLFGSRLPQCGHRIDGVFQSREPGGARRTGWGGGRAWVAGRVAADASLSRVRNALRRYWTVARALSSVWGSDYEFIQVRDGHLTGLMGFVVAKLARRPFVYWMSFPRAQGRLQRARATRGVLSWLARLRWVASSAALYGLLLPRAAHVFVQSQRMADDLARRGVAPSRMTTVPMGVDPGSTRPAEVQKPDGERWIGHLGTLALARGVDVVVEAFARIQSSHPDTRLILVGDADRPDMRWWARRIVELGVEDKVLLMGQRSREEALGYMLACDVCVSAYALLPSQQSTSPTKLVEYLFLARPVVASEHPEQRRVIQESGGGVCVRYDAEAFAEAIGALLDDPKRRAEMGARGRAWVLRHRSYERIAADVDRSYRAILSR